jgi:hypothetical protein
VIECRLDFSDVSHFANLERLDVSLSLDLTESHLEVIGSLRQLRYLNLSCSGLRNRNISVDSLCKALSPLTHLTELNLTCFIFSEQVNLPSTQSWSINGVRVGSRSCLSVSSESKLLECLKGLKMLETLWLPSGIAAWGALNVLPALRELRLSAEDLSVLCSDFPILECMDIVKDWVRRIDSFQAAFIFYQHDDYSSSPTSFLSIVKSAKNSDIYIPFILSEIHSNASLGVNFVPEGGWPSIFDASLPGALAALVVAGANINDVDPYTSSTVLEFLLEKAPLVECALQYGADPMIGVPIEKAINRSYRESFNILLDSTKERILEYDEKSLAGIVQAALRQIFWSGASHYFDALAPIIGKRRMYGSAKSYEAELLSRYSNTTSALPHQIEHAVAAGINLRLPEPIQESVIWQIYKKSNTETRQLIKNYGLLNDAEIAELDAAQLQLH